MNRGEWSEAYALLKLLQSPNFLLVDAQLNPQNISQYRVNTIGIPGIAAGKFVEFKALSNSVFVSYDGQTNTVPLKDIHDISSKLLTRISNSSQRTFTFHELGSLWGKFFNPQIKATNSNKSDIQLEILDAISGNKVVSGFSIKSNLGGATSLLNASQATNFLFEAPQAINGAGLTPKKLGKLVKPLSIKCLGSVNQTYKNSLQTIDPKLEDLIGLLLIEYYGSSNRERYIRDLLKRIENSNPFGLPNTSQYQQMISKFLEATAFGMVPTHSWNGALSANGGMVIVKGDGDLACFYMGDKISKSNLENYLIDNCFLDTASTSRHDFGKVFDDKFFKFNLLIRL